MVVVDGPQTAQPRQVRLPLPVCEGHFRVVQRSRLLISILSISGALVNAKKKTACLIALYRL